MSLAPKEQLQRRLIDRLRLDVRLGRLIGVVGTTFEFDAGFVETDFLPTLLSLGAWDDTNWSSRIELERRLQELDDVTFVFDPRGYHRRPRSLRVGAVAWTANNSLHAKVLLLLAERGVVVLVGSANLTEAGFRRNREVAAVLTVTPTRTEAASMAREALDGLDALLRVAGATPARHVVAEAKQRLDSWSGEDAQTSDRLVWSGPDTRLLDSILAEWPSDETVQAIDIVSPFWSEGISGGPVAALARGLVDRGALAKECRLTLRTEAADSRTAEENWLPVLPKAYAEFDFRQLGFGETTASVVDPRVDDAEVGVKGFAGKRPLHAKVLLLAGPRTSLLYLGSANCTRSGWGAGLSSNVEAGLILRRQGRERKQLAAQLPRSFGKPMLLHGGPAVRVRPPPADAEAQPWPRFIRSVELVPEEGGETTRLRLQVELSGAPDVTEWRIHQTVDSEDTPGPELLYGKGPVTAGRAVTSLSVEALSRLLVSQEVIVRWQPGGARRIPINIAPVARPNLPLSPTGAQPREEQILEYYQGRIPWAALFPNPAEEGHGTGAIARLDFDDLDWVDTSNITSYRIRAFVESLPGLIDDVSKASVSTGALRMALLGPVSPVALSKLARSATLGSDTAAPRSTAASAFQILELLACLAEVRTHIRPGDGAAKLQRIVDEAVARIEGDLSELRAADKTAFASNRTLARFERELRRHYRWAAARP